MKDAKIRVGIIGAGGWAKYGHIPALQTLEQFEVVAVSSRKQKTADETAAQFNIPHATFPMPLETNRRSSTILKWTWLPWSRQLPNTRDWQKPP